MELDSGFKHSGTVKIGGGNVTSMPSAPSTIQMLHSSLQSTVKPLHTAAQAAQDDADVATGTIQDTSDSSGLNTSNTPSNGRVDNMRKFLQNRK